MISPTPPISRAEAIEGRLVGLTSLGSISSGSWDSIEAVAWQPRGALLAVANRLDLSFWRVQRQEPDLRVKTPQGRDGTEHILSIAWAPDGSAVATSNWDGVIRTWSSHGGSLLAEFMGKSTRIDDLSWSPNGRLIAAATLDCSIEVWDVNSKRLIVSLWERGACPTALVWSTAGDTLISCESDGKVVFWDPNAGTVRNTLVAHTACLTDLALSRASGLMATSDNEGMVKLWRGNSLLHSVRCRECVYDVDFSYDGRLLLARTMSNDLLFFRTDTFSCVGAFNQGETMPVNGPGIAMHPDGPILAAVGMDGSGDVVDVWALDPGTLLAPEGSYATTRDVRLINNGDLSVRYDCFICHASEDKATFVDELAALLDRAGCRVWYDSHRLRVGDSLSAKIEEGLLSSRHGIVVLSRNFFKKHWPRKELEALHTRVASRTILPVWHDVTYDEVALNHPLLAGILAARSSEGMVVVVQKLLQAMDIDKD